MTDLSPAAQAIKNAVLALYPDRRTFKWVWSLCRPIAAATLCAVADQVAPSDAAEPRNYLPASIECQRIREELLAIATELRNHQ